MASPSRARGVLGGCVQLCCAACVAVRRTVATGGRIGGEDRRSSAVYTVAVIPGCMIGLGGATLVTGFRLR
jgi:hypothetical protein